MHTPTPHCFSGASRGGWTTYYASLSCEAMTSANTQKLLLEVIKIIYIKKCTNDNYSEVGRSVCVNAVLVLIIKIWNWPIINFVETCSTSHRITHSC